MQQTKFYNAQRLWSIVVALCLLTPLQLHAQKTLILKDSIGGVASSGDGGFSEVLGTAIASDGSIYVVDEKNSRVQKFDKAGNYVSQFGGAGNTDGKFNRPSGVALDSQGNVWVTDRSNNRIQKFDKDGKFVKTVGTLVATNSNGDFSQPIGIVIDAADNIYVVDLGNDRVQKLDKDGKFIKVIGSKGSGNGQFEGAYGITIDKDANIYVADILNHNVQKFDSAGTYKATIGGAGTGDGKFADPAGVAIDPDGFLYVSDTDRDSIQIFNSSGSFVKKYATPTNVANKSEGFLTFDANGNLYISDAQNLKDRVYIYAPDKEINLKIGSISLASGGTVDYGSVIVSQSSKKTFTIENLGGIDLTLKGTSGSQVAVSGTNATDFVVTQTSVTDKITGFSNVTFDVSYTPATTGTSTATLTITSDDANEGTYTVNLTGTSTSNVTGRDPDLTGGSVMVGPNPTKGKLGLTIEGKSAAKVSYQIVNMQGQVVATGVPSNGGIDMSQLQAGNYLLLLQIGDEQVTRRVQKK